MKKHSLHGAAMQGLSRHEDSATSEETAMPFDVYGAAFNDLMIMAATGKPFTNQQALHDHDPIVLASPLGIFGVGHDFQQDLTLYVLEGGRPITVTAKLRVIRRDIDGTPSLFLRSKLVWTEADGNHHDAHGQLELTDEAARELAATKRAEEAAKDKDDNRPFFEGGDCVGFTDFTGEDMADMLDEHSLNIGLALDDLEGIYEVARRYKAIWTHTMAHATPEAITHHQLVVTAARNMVPGVDMTALLLDFGDDLASMIELTNGLGLTLPGAVDFNDIVRIRFHVQHELAKIAASADNSK